MTKNKWLVLFSVLFLFGGAAAAGERADLVRKDEVFFLQQDMQGLKDKLEVREK